jgi:hypothetical protein
VRIIHFEDEWAKTRSIPHRLHDMIFEFISPDKKVQLELKDLELSAPGQPSTITVSLDSTESHTIFEYVLVTDIDTLKSMAVAEDIVIVDIMRSDENGYFVSMLEPIQSLFAGGDYNKDNWRYFSAFPEEVPDNCVLGGFTKKQAAELVQFLFGKVRERQPWL